ncbi:MAG TPA: acetylornithine deacetylase [Azospirillaceae bacterium]|nr:acetylornithine deacetylase [Azospirillaceae bacterium]
MTAPTSAIEILDRLIAFDTVSSRSNLDLIAWVADHLDGLGVPVRLTHDDEGRKANLWATIGPEDKGGVVLSGHTDVVPVEQQVWTSDPFKMVERDGKLFGRGTADMKAFIALCLANAPDFLARNLKTPIHFAFSYDEEVGCFGVQRLVADVVKNLPLPRLAIIGEPTEMRIIAAHKGGCVLRCTVKGHAAHASSPQLGANAIYYAADIVRFIRDLQEEFKAKADPASGFSTPFTSFNVGTIQGGVANNVVAPECALNWEFRAMPGTDPAEIVRRVEDYVRTELLPRLKAETPDGDIRMVKLYDVMPLVPEPDSEAEQVVRRLTGANSTGVVSFGTEAGTFQAAGIPAVVCGPGSIDQAHQPDEFISLDQVAKGDRFMKALAAWAST